MSIFGIQELIAMCCGQISSQEPQLVQFSAVRPNFGTSTW